MSKWSTDSLRGKIHVKHGWPFKSDFFRKSGRYVVLTPGNFHEAGGFKRNEGKDKYYSEAFPPEYLLKKDDVLVAMTEQAEGLLGSTAMVPEGGKFLHNQRLGLITAISGEVIPEFLYHLFKTRKVREQISLSSTGSKVKHTSPERIYDVLVQIPPIKEQKGIAAVLTALEAKIEVNHRINAELEGMAKLLYDYWFVQFEFPLSAAQAKALGNPRLTGKPYKSSGGKMTYATELKRDIPDGWDVRNLLEIATFTNGIACQKYPQTDEAFLRVIKIKEMRDGFTDTSETVTAEVPEKVVVDDGDILFSWSASLEVMIWAGGKGALNQHIFKVTSKEYPRSYCYFTLMNYLQHFKMLANLRKTTMGHITREHLEQSRIAIPPEDLTEALESKLFPLLEHVVNHHQQNQELTALRDWLLPLLMNGQVVISQEALT